MPIVLNPAYNTTANTIYFFYKGTNMSYDADDRLMDELLKEAKINITENIGLSPSRDKKRSLMNHCKKMLDMLEEKLFQLKRPVNFLDFEAEEHTQWILSILILLELGWKNTNNFGLLKKYIK